MILRSVSLDVIHGVMQLLTDMNAWCVEYGMRMVCGYLKTGRYTKEDK